MDASTVFVLSILLSCAHLSSQKLNEDDRNRSSARTTTNATPAQVILQNTTVNKNCTTATGVLGNCILRRFCNYGTDAIDLTLYVPKGFIQPCKVDEACCPVDYQLAVVPTYNHNQTEKDFEFDNDD